MPFITIDTRVDIMIELIEKKAIGTIFRTQSLRIGTIRWMWATTMVPFAESGQFTSRPRIPALDFRGQFEKFIQIEAVFSGDKMEILPACSSGKERVMLANDLWERVKLASRSYRSGSWSPWDFCEGTMHGSFTRKRKVRAVQ